MQMGAPAAAYILRASEGQPLRPFHYHNLGDMATIGRASAVANLPWIQLDGYLAWLAWLFIHLIKLIGFRNRIVVMVQWMWAYFSYQRAIRLITGNR
jgi:NADH dehydrogenase